MADYQWPQADNRTLIGKRISRVDGPLKSSGRATYTYDVQRPGLLFGKMVLSPHAHARIVSIDTSQAERLPGVQAVDVIREAGQEVLWAGQEILAVAAETEEQARDAARAVKITYEKLPHLVSDVEPAQAGDRAEEEAEQVTGDPEAGFEEADATIEGRYGSPVITHCCLESHGQVAEWEGENLTVWASTQNVSGLVGQYAEGLQIPAGNVRTITPVMGGGFGSKFQADTWGLSCARLARKARRPVKMMLERDQELLVAGARPSIHARVRAGAKRDGTLTAWSSQAWGTGGITSRGSVNLPYIFQVPNPPVQLLQGLHQHRSCSCLARAPASPDVLDHHGGIGRPGGRAGHGRAGLLPEECWHRGGAGRDLPAGAAQGRGTDGVEKRSGIRAAIKPPAPVSAAWDLRSTPGAAAATRAIATVPSTPTARWRSRLPARTSAPAPAP